MRFQKWLGIGLCVAGNLASQGAPLFGPDDKVGRLPSGGEVIPTSQILRMAGQRLEFPGRPVDLVFAPNGRQIYVKNTKSLVVIDAVAWKVAQTLEYRGSGASLHGIAVSKDGSHVYVTGSDNELYEWEVAADGKVSFSRTIRLPKGSDPCGLSLTKDGRKAFVCLSIRNTLAEVTLADGAVTRQIPVGVAPWNVLLSDDDATAFVSDWGGRAAGKLDLTSDSAGTEVVVDSRGVASTGALSFVDLAAGRETAQTPTGLHPCDLALTRDGRTLYVANANSDTVMSFDTATHVARETIPVRPGADLPFGSEPDALARSPDGKLLFAACAGNNAVAVIRLSNKIGKASTVEGFFPTDWYPGAIFVDKSFAYVLNVKGVNGRAPDADAESRKNPINVGTLDRIAIPAGRALKASTEAVIENGRLAQIKLAFERGNKHKAAAPVPSHYTEPSVFKHVVYILKENKTFDEMFGDLPRGNSDPKLCIYPEKVSPNHHALAMQYVLLDNFYCNGVISADGHSWCTEGNSTDHLEKSFGGFARSYTFGDDPLTYSSSGFIWENALAHGVTFRNYGEFDYASVPSKASWLDIYKNFTNGGPSIAYAQKIGVAALRPYSSTNVPGWNLSIPDVVRADGFIKELRAAEIAGQWTAFHLLYLPNDHTGGPPPPEAQVADNDLALGRVVEAITRSAFGSNTVIFVMEDDPQSGFDHVDGHRSLCLVISPYTKRGQTISAFYNQTGVLHTMEQILGLPPMNQQDALGPLMGDCFVNTPDFTPYTALSNKVDLVAGSKAKMSSKAAHYFKKVRKMDFTQPDRIDENVFNRYVWHNAKGNARYPAEFAGAHGKGLKALGLVLDKQRHDDDD